MSRRSRSQEPRIKNMVCSRHRSTRLYCILRRRRWAVNQRAIFSHALSADHAHVRHNQAPTHLRSVPAVVTHGYKRIEGVPPQAALAVHMLKARHAEVVPALLARLHRHLSVDAHRQKKPSIVCFHPTFAPGGYKSSFSSSYNSNDTPEKK